MHLLVACFRAAEYHPKMMAAAHSQLAATSATRVALVAPAVAGRLLLAILAVFFGPLIAAHLRAAYRFWKRRGWRSLR